MCKETLKKEKINDSNFENKKTGYRFISQNPPNEK
jgi:hypothetical protein